MARWAVLFDNDTEHPKLRDQAHKDAHHAYLAAHPEIRMAGAVSDDAGRPFTGGMWIVEADDRDRAMALARECPFYRSGVHRTMRVMWWGAAPGLEGRHIVDQA